MTQFLRWLLIGVVAGVLAGAVYGADYMMAGAGLGAVGGLAVALGLRWRAN